MQARKLGARAGVLLDDSQESRPSQSPAGSPRAFEHDDSKGDVRDMALVSHVGMRMGLVVVVVCDVLRRNVCSGIGGVVVIGTRRQDGGGRLGLIFRVCLGEQLHAITPPKVKGSSPCQEGKVEAAKEFADRM